MGKIIDCTEKIKAHKIKQELLGIVELIDAILEMDKKFGESYFNDGLYRIYPNDVILRRVGGIEKKQRIEITTNDIE